MTILKNAMRLYSLKINFSKWSKNNLEVGRRVIVKIVSSFKRLKEISWRCCWNSLSHVNDSNTVTVCFSNGVSRSVETKRHGEYLRNNEPRSWIQGRDIGSYQRWGQRNCCVVDTAGTQLKHVYILSRHLLVFLLIVNLSFLKNIFVFNLRLFPQNVNFLNQDLYILWRKFHYCISKFRIGIFTLSKFLLGLYTLRLIAGIERLVDSIWLYFKTELDYSVKFSAFNVALLYLTEITTICLPLKLGVSSKI